MVAVCQPGPPVLAAAALMAEDGDPHRPASLTLLGSPIDARLVAHRDQPAGRGAAVLLVPAGDDLHRARRPMPGVLRRVYPGFVQLYSFMSMNAERHQEAHRRYFDNLVDGDGDSADKHREFYDEYLSVLDLTEEFYLQTVDMVFQRYLLPKGELVHRGRPVRLGGDHRRGD